MKNLTAFKFFSGVMTVFPPLVGMAATGICGIMML